jgi:Na+-transporting NADH:ubiquinone oxidoreductase subunit D
MGYKNNGMMLLPPMALIMLALVIWAQRSRTKSLIEKE